jgi:hypothetical protein
VPLESSDIIESENFSLRILTSAYLKNTRKVFERLCRIRQKESRFLDMLE